MYAIDIYAEVRHAVLVEKKSMRETARLLGIDRKTVRKILDHGAPPGYQRTAAPPRPKLGPYTKTIDRLVRNDAAKPRNQRRTARQIFEYLVAKHAFEGGLTTVKDYVRSQRQTLESGGAVGRG
jgi:transposase